MDRDKSQRQRWLFVLLVVLGVHVCVGYWWFMHVPHTAATVPTPVAVGMGSQDNAANGIEAFTQSSEVLGAVSSERSSALPPPNSAVHQNHASVVEAANNGTENTLHNLANSSGNNHKNPSSTTEINASMVGQSVGVGSGDTQTNGAEQKPLQNIDCSATQKSTHAPAGMDAKVWVERTAKGGAVFLGLVNQQSDASRYLSEVKRAVSSIRFVSQDVRCTGVRLSLTVRIVL